MARKNSNSEKRKVKFSITAPQAHEVALLGDFTDWEKAPVALKKQSSGEWAATLSLSPGEYQYRLRVDGQWQDDPTCAAHVPNSFGSQNCVRQVV